MQYWLVKQEPESYPWKTFAREKKTSWEGVRNFAARNHLRAMRRGDQVLFYASGDTKAVVGLAEVTKEAYADPSAEEGDWSAVELKALRAIANPVTLAQIKADKLLSRMELVRQSRLSVVPVAEAEFRRIIELSAG